MQSTSYHVDGIARSGKIAFLIMLICNLSFYPFYSQAFAQEGEGGGVEVPGCPPLPSTVPQEIKDYYDDYQSVHEQIFATPNTWCSASGWLLDEDVSEVIDPWTPTLVTGSIFGGETFWAEVYDVTTIDWESLGLLPDSIQIAEAADFEFRVVGMIVHGDVGDLPVWGFTYTFTGTAAQTRQTVFLFAKHAPVIPPVEQVGSLGWEEDCTSYPDGSREKCLCIARANLRLCLDAARSNYVIDSAANLTALIASVLACIAAAALASGPFAPLTILIACGIGSMALLYALIDAVFDLAGYLNARNICFSQYDIDVQACPSQ